MSVTQTEDIETNVPREIDIAALADEVYRLLLEELRIEQERQPQQCVFHSEFIAIHGMYSLIV